MTRVHGRRTDPHVPNLSTGGNKVHGAAALMGPEPAREIEISSPSGNIKKSHLAQSVVQSLCHVSYACCCKLNFLFQCYGFLSGSG